MKLPTLRQSSWYDLVFHTIAMLPVSGQDASGLHDVRYVDWINARMPPADEGTTRTAVEDGALMAALYDRAPQAFRLQSFPLLHENIDEFMAGTATAWQALAWQDPARGQIARMITNSVPEDLVDLFRIAMWSEVRSGYRALWDAHVAPAFARHASTLRDGLEQAARWLPEVATTDWVVSHPLRRAGRLFQRTGTRVIAIGLPDHELRVETSHALTQGCHELVLSFVPAAKDDGLAETTRHAAGFVHHMRREVLALCLHASLVRATPLEAVWSRWLRAYYPDGVAQLAHRLPWEVAAPTPTISPADWLAAGSPVPPDLARTYEALVEELISARRSAT